MAEMTGDAGGRRVRPPSRPIFTNIRYREPYRREVGSRGEFVIVAPAGTWDRRGASPCQPALQPRWVLRVSPRGCSKVASAEPANAKNAEGLRDVLGDPMVSIPTELGFLLSFMKSVPEEQVPGPVRPPT